MHMCAISQQFFSDFLSDILMNCLAYSVSLGWQTMAEMATLCIPVLTVGLRKGKSQLVVAVVGKLELEEWLVSHEGTKQFCPQFQKKYSPINITGM